MYIVIYVHSYICTYFATNPLRFAYVLPPFRSHGIAHVLRLFLDGLSHLSVPILFTYLDKIQPIACSAYRNLICPATYSYQPQPLLPHRPQPIELHRPQPIYQPQPLLPHRPEQAPTTSTSQLFRTYHNQ
jgi:hypothetical protein